MFALRALSLALAAATAAVEARNIPLHARVVDQNVVNNSTYDFIIAGGGIGGLTVADRLTENKNITVLVVETGPFDNYEDFVLIPGSYGISQYVGFTFSVPQKNLNFGVYPVLAGKVVGGGSVVNAMFLLRGQKNDYDGWKTIGPGNWGWTDLLPYFKKSENFTKPDPAFAASHNISYDATTHGYSGPLQVSFSPYDYAPSGNFWTAGLSLGFKPAKDPSDGDGVGLAWFPRALDGTTRTRSSARINHYDRVKASRPNYHILPNTHVSKVLFTKANIPKASGLEIIDRATGKVVQVQAKKEVIVSAGAVHTPQILQLSGIGQKSVLQAKNITVVQDLPGVGQNFHDHLTLKVDYNFTKNLYPNVDTFLNNATYNAEQRALYDSKRLGAYTLLRTTGNNVIVLPLRNTTTNASAIIASAKAINPATALPANAPPSVLKGYTAERSVLLSQYDSTHSAIASLSWNTGFETEIYMVKPLSRGYVTINTTNPLDEPLLDFNALADPTDLELTLQVYKLNRRIFQTQWMQALGPIETSPAPGDNNDASIKEKIRANLVPSNAHPCGTARIGTVDNGGVVDGNLKVWGVSGLRVVDASVFPYIPGTAPSGTVYGVAEKAADLIKADWGL